MSYFRFLFCGEEWTRTTELLWGQIYSLLQLPLCDFPVSIPTLLAVFLFAVAPCGEPHLSESVSCEACQSIDPSRWRDSNPRQADYKSATLPTELHRLSITVSNNSFLFNWGCKDTTFLNNTNFFFKLFPLPVHILLIHKNILSQKHLSKAVILPWKSS